MEIGDPKQETQEKIDQLQGTENREVSGGHLQPEDPPSRHGYLDHISLSKGMKPHYADL